jgi:hypothetical protein
MTQCEYLEKAFKIDKNTARLLKSIELETAIDYNEQDTMGGLPQLEIKGFKPQSFTVSYTAVNAAGTDRLQEYRAWKKKLGNAGNFYIGAEQFGVDIFTLKSVSLNDAKVSVRGEFITGTIQLGLTQDIAAGGN